MNSATDTNNPGLGPGDQLSGFEIVRVAKLEEMAAWFYEATHLPTGARYIHISNADKENTFCVGLKTVPRDSTGVAHILEHTVLCGSRHYPVRDPFFSMLKRSLSTFMNAFTSSDWTLYPFCTQNKTDFYNLMGVYLDAVFFPNLDELSFKQEGHRLDLEPGEGENTPERLVYKGVVYNEMKGALSSPRQVLASAMLANLYPQTTYRHNSGGDPNEIPRLTHDQLKGFHQRHYHPSNAFFYTYGNLPLESHLAFIEKTALREFNQIDPDTDVPSQPRWSTSRETSAPYRLAKNEDPAKKGQACVAWLMTDIKDGFEILVLAVLEQILLGNSASPLRKALMDSGLGSAPSDVFGFDADNRDTLFVCGLKDVAVSSAKQIETLVMETLSSLADQGIDPRLIDAAIHQIEFHKKEVTNTPYPYGLKLVLSFLGSWLHGGDPIRFLELDAYFERLRRELGQGEFLEGKIRHYFLDNSHRLLLTLVPDQQLEEKEHMRTVGVLDRIKQNLSESQLDRIKQDAQSLQALQEKEEEISILPTLALEEIPPKGPEGSIQRRL